MVRDKEVAVLAQRALQAAAPDVKDLAAEADLNYGTMRAWRAGRRSPSPENLEALADLLDGRAELIQELATRLRRAAEKGDT